MLVGLRVARKAGRSPIKSAGKSAVDEVHHGFRVAKPGSSASRSNFLNPLEVGGRQLHVKRAEIFLQVFSALGTGNREDVDQREMMLCRQQSST